MVNDPDSPPEWPPDEIKLLAQSSGKPLEVSCAQEFLRAGFWTARLGTYFTEGENWLPRELDVLAERTDQRFEGESKIECRMRVLLSCRGFPSSKALLTYTVSKKSVPPVRPRFILSLGADRLQVAPGWRLGDLPRIETEAAAALLASTGIDRNSSIAAFDVIEQVEKPKAGKPTLKREKDADRRIYEAVDGAVKAALFWSEQDSRVPPPESTVTLNIPLCVVSKAFWEVCIDRGDVSDPVLNVVGYQTGSFPRVYGNVVDSTVLILSAEYLGHLVGRLQMLFEWFCDEIRDAMKRRVEHDFS